MYFQWAKMIWEEKKMWLSKRSLDVKFINTVLKISTTYSSSDGEIEMVKSFSMNTKLLKFLFLFIFCCLFWREAR